MCVIIIKQKGKKVDEDVLKLSSTLNPHGLGIVWLDTYKIEKVESTQWMRLKTNRPYIAHFRFATQGAVNQENIHPFLIPNNNGTEWLMQNGTIYDYKGQTECDTLCMANDLGIVKRDFWKEVLEMHDCRFVTVNQKTKNFQVYNKQDWFKVDGVWFSKANVLKKYKQVNKQEHLIAVYGTLKHSYSNYHRYLSNADYVDIGETIDKYPLIIDGLPYLVDDVGIGHNVDVDVFKVNDAELKQIDMLEGHPRWYKRKQIKIRTCSEGVLKCWVYFNPTEDYLNQTHHATFQQKYELTNQNYELWH